MNIRLIQIDDIWLVWVYLGKNRQSDELISQTIDLNRHLIV